MRINIPTEITQHVQFLCELIRVKCFVMRHLQILCDFVDANETFFLSKLKMLELLRWSLANVGNSNYQTISEKKSRTRLRFYLCNITCGSSTFVQCHVLSYF